MFSSIGYYTGLNYPAYYLYAKTYSYLNSYTKPGNDITKIADELYISDFPTATNKKTLITDGITHVITCVYGMAPYFPETFVYKTIPLIDSPNENIFQYFDSTNKYIDDAIHNQDGKILVHCICGASRSATILASYIIYKGKGKVNVKDALKYLKQKRDLVDPNPGYIKQLEKYSKIIKQRSEKY